MKKNLIKVINLGRIGFTPAYEIQTELVRRHLDYLKKKSSIVPENSLLLLEHHPVYTIGIRRRGYTQDDEERLIKTGQFHIFNRLSHLFSK